MQKARDLLNSYTRRWNCLLLGAYPLGIYDCVHQQLQRQLFARASSMHRLLF